MSPVGVLLDACILFPAALRDTLLRAAGVGLYRLHWSEGVLQEVGRSLIRTERLTALQADGLLEAMREAFPEAAVTGYEVLIDQMANATEDRHVLAAAVAAGAQVIVTANLKDFPDQALVPYGVEAQHPDEFLKDLFDLEPELMPRIVLEQAAELQKLPMTVMQVLDEIALHAPGFAALVREKLRC